MKSLFERLFFCYATEDRQDVLMVVRDLEHELGSKVLTAPQNAVHMEFSPDISHSIEDVDIVVVFLSEAARKSDYVRQCIKYANDINKTILPIDLGKMSKIGIIPQEFKFRTNSYNYKNEDSRAQLFAHLKASLGIDFEGGDNYGAIIHVVIDEDSAIYRYGTKLGTARRGEDCIIRLTKGCHLLELVPLGRLNARCNYRYEVKGNDGEYYIKLSIPNLLKQQESANEKAEIDAQKRKSNIKITLMIISLLSFLGMIGGVFYYKNVYLPEKRDAEAPRYYTFATSVRMRSTSEFDVEYNKLESLPYGTEVLVYDSMPGRYYYGKVAPKDAKGKVMKDKCIEGYVAYDYMLPKSDFFLLNSIFGNEEARKMLDESRYRRALLQYYKMHNYVGEIAVDKLEVYGLKHLANAEKWQVFCKDKKATSNNVYRSRKYNKESKYPDVAIILKNVSSRERKLLFFTFDDIDGTPRLLCEQSVAQEGYMKDGTLKLLGSDYSGYYVDVTYVN